MALTQEQKQALANETRKTNLKVKIAKLQGKADQAASVASLLSSQANDAQIQLAEAQQELSALEAGAGPGITDEFGERSTVDNAALVERTAGQLAVIMAIKSNPNVTLEEALTLWNQAALESRPADRQWLLCNPMNLLSEYVANAVEWGYITEPTWDALKTWVVNTPIEDMV